MTGVATVSCLRVRWLTIRNALCFRLYVGTTGNKGDKESERKVSTEEAKDLCKEHGFVHFETSVRRVAAWS